MGIRLLEDKKIELKQERKKNIVIKICFFKKLANCHLCSRYYSLARVLIVLYQRRCQTDR